MKKKKTYGLALQDRKNVECCFASSSSSCFVFFFLGLLFCFARQRTSYDRALVNYIRIEEKKNIRNKLLINTYILTVFDELWSRDEFPLLLLDMFCILRGCQLEHTSIGPWRMLYCIIHCLRLQTVIVGIGFV